MTQTSFAAAAADHAPRLRGIVSARAEGAPADLPGTIEAINRAVAEMRAKAEAAQGAIDVVRNEELSRINASISDLTALANAQRETLDALRVSGGGGNAANPAAREHRDAFNQWFRRGGDREVEASLNGLAARAALTTQSDPDGGFVVPAETDSVITRVLATVSGMRSLARVVSTGSGSYKTIVSQGGATAGWVGEEAARGATSTPQLAQMEVVSGEIYANAYITQRMLDDASFDVAQWLAEEISTTFGEKEGLAFISGSGINQPKGFLSETQIANSSHSWGKIGFVATGSSGAFATAGADNLIALHYALKEGYRNGAAFLMSDATLATVRAFKDTTNNYIWAPPTVDGPATILGKPVVTDDNMPVIAANSFSVAFGNFQRGYLINDRLGTRVLRDPYTNKPYVGFYVTKRVGGGVVNFEAIKTLKFA